jgi:hypothetical protein
MSSWRPAGDLAETLSALLPVAFQQMLYERNITLVLQQT